MPYWTDKVALVTGGSGGLGSALGKTFAAAGAKVVLAARHAERLEAVVDAIRQTGGSAIAVAADVTQQADVENLFRRTIDEFGRLDALVNAAGRSARGQVIDTTPEEFAELLDLNFLSVVRCVRAAVPHLLKTRGHLVNISSLAGKAATRYVGAYPASKFALAAYTQQLRLELSPGGLHVLLVSPGPIARPDTAQRYAEQTANLPERARKPGAGVKFRAIQPEDLSRAILRACERRRTELIYPTAVRLLLALGALSPSLGDWIVRRLT
ncbi:MAG TPA: SDR family NAD(P)-dependent oxidoreductase [Pirellulales bacterium]|jgi:NAD(P)-dependent dehydrogenase (short-subunit alcohol dehydrogenase family)|nr:SDR family NAD(P)-dependent oxidoreductase [Pirellulales bacterium]